MGTGRGAETPRTEQGCAEACCRGCQGGAAAAGAGSGAGGAVGRSAWSSVPADTVFAVCCRVAHLELQRPRCLHLFNCRRDSSGKGGHLDEPGFGRLHVLSFVMTRAHDTACLNPVFFR